MTYPFRFNGFLYIIDFAILFKDETADEPKDDDKSDTEQSENKADEKGDIHTQSFF